MYKVEFRDDGSAVVKEYRGVHQIRESEAVGYQQIAVLKGHNDHELIMGFSAYYDGSHGLKSGVAYRVIEA